MSEKISLDELDRMHDAEDGSEWAAIVDENWPAISRALRAGKAACDYPISKREALRSALEPFDA